MPHQNVYDERWEDHLKHFQFNRIITNVNGAKKINWILNMMAGKRSMRKNIMMCSLYSRYLILRFLSGLILPAFPGFLFLCHISRFPSSFNHFHSIFLQLWEYTKLFFFGIFFSVSYFNRFACIKISSFKRISAFSPLKSFFRIQIGIERIDHRIQQLDFVEIMVTSDSSSE